MKPVSHFRALVFAPFVYVFIVPVLIFHGALEFYHQIVFRGFRIPRVRLRDHLVLDRGLLKHLGPIERVNCCYCGYVNGLFAYAREIGARSELYWCPIKHRRDPAQPHAHYGRFFDPDDESATLATRQKRRLG